MTSPLTPTPPAAAVRRSQAALVMSLLLPLLVLCSVWWPEFNHYHTQSRVFADSTSAALRDQPSDATLKEVNAFNYGIVSEYDAQQARVIADRMLQGELALPGLEPAPITLPFRKDELLSGLPGRQLRMASLVIPSVLLDAYQSTGAEKYYLAARDALRAWMEFETDSWVPTGFIWDDHATAARIQVYAKFWSIYRHRADYDAALAGQLLAAVDRNCQILARPSHFTFSTNHGVMQNLALLHAAVAFPGLPDSRTYRDTAVQRLKKQMDFYISDAGVVTEHSLGYQYFGLNLVAIALRYLTLLDMTIPDTWSRKYQRALEFYATVRLPDDTLPMYGDTGSEANPPLLIAVPVDKGYALQRAAAGAMRPANATLFNPTVGYAAWWSGLERWPETRALRQTLIAWPNFVSHAHKHADEMSVLFWAGGQHWWNNVGYWPYGIAPREQAVSWDGSNAPHLQGEGFSDARDTRVLRYGQTPHSTVLDLERSRPDGYRARRQVISTAQDQWFVIDYVSDAARRTSTHIWTTRPDVKISTTQSMPSAFNLESPTTTTRLRAIFTGAAGVAVERRHGSENPFAGWVALGSKVHATNAFEVQMPAQSWSLVAWRVDDATASAEPVQPRMARWSGPEQWSIEWHDAHGARQLTRDGDIVRLADATGSDVPETLTLSPPPDTSAAAEKLTAAFGALAAESEKRPVYFAYRVKFTQWVLGLLLMQEVFLALYRHVFRHRTGWLRWSAVAAWTTIGVWAQLSYFT